MLPYVDIKKGFKVIGYIACDNLERICGVEEECIVAGSEESMRGYLRKLGNPDIAKIIIKKIRFSEIMENLLYGVTYSFDRESYSRFLPIAEMNEVKNLPPIEKFLEGSSLTSTGELSFRTVRLI
jgi:hypothetical protein